MKKLYFISGTMGVGKSTICNKLKQELPRCVFLDGDNCWNMHPFIVNQETIDMVLDNICHLLNNFLQCSIYDNVVFCWVMHKQEIIDSILNQINLENCKLINITLIADEKTIYKRLSKDIKDGIRTDDVINRSLERIPLYNSLDTIKINTINKSIDEIVLEIKNI